MAASRITRRAVVTAMAIAPIAPIAATAAPLAYQATSRHGCWLNEHVTVHEQVKRTHDNALVDRLSDRMCALERLVVDTPAASPTEARDKVQFALMMHREEIAFDVDDAVAVISDLSRYVT